MVDNTYPARLDIDYPDRLDRLTTLFRLIWAIPILVIMTLITATGTETVINEAGEEMRRSGGGIAGGLFVATMLLILFRQRYPRWRFQLRPRASSFLGPSRRLPSATHRPIPVHRGRTVRPFRPRLPRRPTRPQPVAPPGQVVPRHPPLHHPGDPRRRGDLRHHHRLVRHPRHRPLPASAIRLCSRGGTMVTPGPGLRLPSNHRRIPTLQPRGLSCAPRIQSRYRASHSCAGWRSQRLRRPMRLGDRGERRGGDCGHRTGTGSAPALRRIE